jgi:hypothetical protein
MSFNGSGTFAVLYSWVTDRNNGTKILASKQDEQWADVAAALTLCMLKDGQQTPTANLTLGGFKITNLGDASSATDAVNVQYLTGTAREYTAVQTYSLTTAGTAPVALKSSEAGASAGPLLELYRDSATPAASDLIGQVAFYSEDSAGNKELSATITGKILDATSGSEDSEVIVATENAGTLANRLHIGQGVYTPAETDKGANTINVTSLYVAGVKTKGGTLSKTLAADDTGADSSSAQPWFPTAGAVTLLANRTYRFEGFIHFIRSAGTNSHTTSVLFGGTATIASIRGLSISSLTNTITSTSAVFVAAASTSATEEISILVTGTLRTGAGGTLIPQFKYSAAPGGAPTIKTNSYFELTDIGSDVVTTEGTWA